jgi:hypothetical protein
MVDRALKAPVSPGVPQCAVSGGFHQGAPAQRDIILYRPGLQSGIHKAQHSILNNIGE